MDVRRKVGHVGHHHHDVGRLQSGVCIQPRQQSVVQHLYLALGRVRLHKAHAGVVCGHVGQVVGQWRKVEQGRLQVLQHRGLAAFVGGCVCGVHKHIHAVELAFVLVHIVKAIEQVQVVAAMFAPCGQQWVRVGVQGVLVGFGQRAIVLWHG